MAKLSLWIPPFSPDYSGAAAVLFDLKTVTAMHDASGCTGNYTGYDEPRWYGSRSAIYCSGLRQMDAVLGDDEKLIGKLTAAAKDVKPDLMALIGSPVPMVIGADLKGIAVELEERTGIPSFGFDTTGTAYYDKGALQAAKALMDRFCQKQETVPGRINILGALPMDFGRGSDLEHLKELLRSAGYEVGLTMAYGYTLVELSMAASAQVNLAVSRFGYLMARYMEERFGIPWLCGFPAGERGAEDYLKDLEQVRRLGNPKIRKAFPEAGAKAVPPGASEGKAGQDAWVPGTETPREGPSVLVIGEQVMSNSLRTAFGTEFGWSQIAVGCLYGREEALSLPQDLDLTEEAQIRQAVNAPEYDLVVADPFLKVLLEPEAEKEFLAFSQYAVSSKLGEQDSACVTGRHFNEWFEERRLS
ncbi:MAG TPA: oxidoreductase [Candidatus Copromonas faecavium]|uniref:Oxidoreductase n=1 Tax=Candidatus Copromonas faecavium (nom. illeg.) TaxID=2840740 RepID=A0A9D1A655_9FIRM|nr:oxidoreductase [Candidatus Copromonas faecavium]